MERPQVDVENLPEPPDRRVGYLLKRAQLALRHAMDLALAQSTLSTSQYAALAQLTADPGLSNAELARRSFVTPQTMHQILHGLERQGLIVRTAHPQHGRILETRPTAEGRQRLAQADAAVRGVEERMLAPLDARGTRALEEALAACAEALGG